MTINDYAITGALILCAGILSLLFINYLTRENAASTKEEITYICNDGRLYSYNFLPTGIVCKVKS